MSKRVLVVEDQEDNRQILRDLLASAGIDMIEAGDGPADRLPLQHLQVGHFVGAYGPDALFGHHIDALAIGDRKHRASTADLEPGQ